MKDWTYFALDERVCLAPCAPFIMLPMFESAARFPAGANPWLLKPIRAFESSRVERASVSQFPLFPFARARMRQSRTTYLLSSRQGRYAHASRFHSSFFVFFSFPLRRRHRAIHTRRRQYLVASHRIASLVTAFPFATSIHPWYHTHRTRRWNRG